MRHTLQTVIPVRLQFGRNETGRYRKTNGTRLAETTEVSTHFATRLTTLALDGLRQSGKLDLTAAAIARLQDTRAGRRKLRAMLHNWRNGKPVYGLVDA